MGVAVGVGDGDAASASAVSNCEVAVGLGAAVAVAAAGVPSAARGAGESAGGLAPDVRLAIHQVRMIPRLTTRSAPPPNAPILIRPVVLFWDRMGGSDGAAEADAVDRGRT